MIEFLCFSRSRCQTRLRTLFVLNTCPLQVKVFADSIAASYARFSSSSYLICCFSFLVTVEIISKDVGDGNSTMYNMIMTQDATFNCMVEVGRRLARGFTGFSRTEVIWCQQPGNWAWVQNVMFSESPAEIVIHQALQPVQDFTMTFQLVVACLCDLSSVGFPSRVKILCQLVDEFDDLDHVFKNTKLLRFLLALHSKYDHHNPFGMMSVAMNANILLAHVVNKFPDLLKMNFFKSNSKKRKLRFNEADVQRWMEISLQD